MEMLLSKRCMDERREDTHPWRAEWCDDSIVQIACISLIFSYPRRYQVFLPRPLCKHLLLSRKQVTRHPRAPPKSPEDPPCQAPSQRRALPKLHRRPAAVRSEERALPEITAYTTLHYRSETKPSNAKKMQPTVARMAQGTLLGKKFPAPVSTLNPHQTRERKKGHGRGAR